MTVVDPNGLATEVRFTASTLSLTRVRSEALIGPREVMHSAFACGPLLGLLGLARVVMDGEPLGMSPALAWEGIRFHSPLRTAVTLSFLSPPPIPELLCGLLVCRLD